MLSADAVQRANSGHPGMPMGMADVATVLFKYYLRFNPKNPNWINRDRFILSAGHGSMLLYSLLYLTGYKSISINDIKNVQIGIAGGSIDKSWILLRAYTIEKYGYDIANKVEPAYAAPPLINGMVVKGELDGALNYWNYTARLKALNFKNIISVTDVLPYLGIGETLPLIGYVFREEWAKNNPETIQSFMSASNEARRILYSSEKEWKRIKKLTGAKNLETLNALKKGFREGIPSENTNDYVEPIKNAFKILANLGGKDLVGDSKELANGVIWIQK